MADPRNIQNDVWHDGRMLPLACEADDQSIGREQALQQRLAAALILRT